MSDELEGVNSSSSLITHHSSLPKTADVIIVGGGIVGASIAWHLTDSGCHDVVILERESRQGLGSTGKATGGVRTQFSTEINIRLSRYSIQFFREFRDRVGGDCGYLPYGYLFVARTDEEMQLLSSNRDLQVSLGARVEVLTRDEISRIVPALRVDDLRGGTFGPDDGFLDPVATMTALTGRATERGARLLTGTEMTAILHDGGRVAGVRTNAGEISSRMVVNCAGAWAGEIVRDLPVLPLRRQLVAIHADLDLREDAPMVLEYGSGFHFRRGPWRTERTPLLIGWPDPAERPNFTTRVDENTTAEMLRRASHRLPGMNNPVVNANYTRAGLYEMSPDHHAILGESSSLRGLFFANGFSGHGVMHSPATGAILADLILRGETNLFDITPLLPDRFAAGRLSHETAVL